VKPQLWKLKISLSVPTASHNHVLESKVHLYMYMIMYMLVYAIKSSLLLLQPK